MECPGRAAVCPVSFAGLPAERRIFFNKPKVFYSAADNLIKQYEEHRTFRWPCSLEREESNMRVEAYNQVQQIYQTKKVNKSQQTGNVSHADKLQISDFGKDFQSAKAAIAKVPDVREDVTAPIKAQIQNGTYGVDNMTFAEKLMSKFDEMI